MKLTLSTFGELEGRMSAAEELDQGFLLHVSKIAQNSQKVVEDDGLFASLDFESGTVFAIYNCHTSNKLWQFLVKHAVPIADETSTSFEGFQWPEHLRKERFAMTEPGEQVIEKMHRHLKYHFDQYDLDDMPTLIGSMYRLYDDDSEEPDQFVIPPIARYKARTHSPFRLDAVYTSRLAHFLRTDHEPLVAMAHLHRAVKELHPRHKWIDATIAAELAIKEALVRLKPELAPLLQRLPSPPPSVLYGKVMQEYLGEQSPVVKAIQKGEQTRNTLVHSPSALAIAEQDAIDYVKDVEIAILHLRTLLNPDDEWLTAAFQQELSLRTQV